MMVRLLNGEQPGKDFPKGKMAVFACFQDVNFSGFQKCIKNWKISCIY